MIPNVRIDFTLDGTPQTLEYRQVPMQAWRDIKAETGFIPGTLLGGLGDLDVEAIIAAVFAARNSNGRRVSFRQVQQDLDRVEEFEPVRVSVNGEVTFGDDEAPETDPPTSGS